MKKMVNFSVNFPKKTIYTRAMQFTTLAIRVMRSSQNKGQVILGKETSLRFKKRKLKKMV